VPQEKREDESNKKRKTFSGPVIAIGRGKRKSRKELLKSSVELTDYEEKDLQKPVEPKGFPERVPGIDMWSIRRRQKKGSSGTRGENGKALTFNMTTRNECFRNKGRGTQTSQRGGLV